MRRTDHPAPPRSDPAPAATTVVCVDPYDLGRRGIAYLAHHYPDLQLVASVRSPAAAEEVLTLTQAQVVTISDALPTRGRELAARLRAIHPRIGLVSVSHHTDDADFPQARAAQMAAFVSRTAPVTAVVAAIRHAAAQPSRFRTFGVPWAVEQQVARMPALSTRESQVLMLMRDGLSAEQMAHQLKVSKGTVRTYVNRIYAKLDVDNRSQALLATAAPTAPLVAPATTSAAPR